MAVALSFIIPAFNEGRRLPRYLPLVREYLEEEYPGQYEVIVVNDGSKDGLARFLKHAESSWSGLVVVDHGRNLGKGAAVRSGVQAARGRLVLFADADGATPIGEELCLRRAIEQGVDIAAGSRLVKGVGSIRQRGRLRFLLGRLFAWWARRQLVVSVRDPQCGFKMFRREVACRLFSLCKESGYAFDLEVLALAQALGYRIAEVPVAWQEVAGSKVRPFRDGWVMLRRIRALRRMLRENRSVHELVRAYGA